MRVLGNYSGLLQRLFFALVTALLFLVAANSAFAQDVSDVADNIVDSTEKLPGLVSALSYILGLILGVRGVFKLKNHVENPGNSNSGGQTPLHVPLIYFLVGGALFSLPIVYETLFVSISGGDSNLDVGRLEAINIFSGLIGITSGITGYAGLANVSTVLSNIVSSVSDLPGLVSAMGYLFGLVIAVNGLLKLKDHVELPEQTKLHESVIRLATAGALFALPSVFNAMYESIDGSTSLLGSIVGTANSFLSGTGFLVSEYGGTESVSCLDVSSQINSIISSGGSGTTMGQNICGMVLYSGAFPAFLTAIAYLFGTVLGFWGILKLRDHVLNPAQTDIFQGISRLMAGGAFFALPALIHVFQNTITNPVTPLAGGIAAVSGYGNSSIVTTLMSLISGGGGGGCPSGLGLDGMLVCFAADLLGPVHVVLNFFAYVAGIILIMIGISRLLKSAQEGARAPGGIGTMMTFLMGGALLSYNELIRAITTTITGNAVTATNPLMSTTITDSMSTSEQEAAHAVISSIVKFMIIIGLISFVRGLFIMRNVAEGNQQASMMAAVTHILGGALAINIGPVLNAVQTTLGIGGYGVTFS